MIDGVKDTKVFSVDLAASPFLLYIGGVIYDVH
jgi:hypothetical protein